MSARVIQQLKSIHSLKIECPNCQEAVSIKRANLFNMYDDAYPAAARKIVDRRVEEVRVMIDGLKIRKEALALDQERKPRRIEVGAHASNFGKISEHILPAFTTFPYRRDECRGLFNPIDYIVFKGLCQSGKIEVIKFVDVKTARVA